jgi:hypothetical protein
VKVKYEDVRLSANDKVLIRHANLILEEYQRRYQLNLTLRQLYYQFVARGLIENTVPAYKRLGNAVNKGRLAGLIDWNHIVDRTRGLRGYSTSETPEEFITDVAGGYLIDKWRMQRVRPEVWIEKDAALGVVDTVCHANQVEYFSCRGFTSQSEMRLAGLRILRRMKVGQTVVIFHVGDHDPSGIDMSRDIEDRLVRFIQVDREKYLIQQAVKAMDELAKSYGMTSFAELRDRTTIDYAPMVEAEVRRVAEFMGEFRFERIALNMDQIQELNPPPNPAKLTDSRAKGYIEQFGYQSWELDAMPPEYLRNLIQDNISSVRDEYLWSRDRARETNERNMLKEIGARWEEVQDFLTDLSADEESRVIHEQPATSARRRAKPRRTTDPGGGSPR